MSGVAVDLEGTSHAFMALEKDMSYNLNSENIDSNDRKNADIGVGNNDEKNNDANNKNNKNIHKNKKNEADDKTNNSFSQNKFSIIESINMARKRKKEKRKREMFCLETACLLMEASYQAYFPLPIDFNKKTLKKEEVIVVDEKLVEINKEKNKKNIELKDKYSSETTANFEKRVTEYSSGVDVSRRLITTAVTPMSMSPHLTTYVQSRDRSQTDDLTCQSTSGIITESGTGTKFQKVESRDKILWTPDSLFPFLQFPSMIKDDCRMSSKIEDTCPRMADTENSEKIDNTGGDKDEVEVEDKVEVEDEDELIQWNMENVVNQTSDLILPDTRTVNTNSDDLSDQNVGASFSKLESIRMPILAPMSLSVSSSLRMPVIFNGTPSTDISTGLSTPTSSSSSYTPNSLPVPILKPEIPIPLGEIKLNTRMDSARTLGPKMDLPRMGLKLLSSFENRDHSTFGFLATTPSAPIYKALLGPIHGNSLKSS